MPKVAFSATSGTNYRHFTYTKIKSTYYYAGCDSLGHLENKEIPYILNFQSQNLTSKAVYSSNTQTWIKNSSGHP